MTRRKGADIPQIKATAPVAFFTQSRRRCSPKRRIAYCAIMVFSLGMALHAHADNEREAATLTVNVGMTGLFDSEKTPIFSGEYRFGWEYYGFRPWLGASWATDGAVFMGGGIIWTYVPVHRDGRRLPWRFTLGFGPGYYERHEGPNLGSHLEFISFAEIGYVLPNRCMLSTKLAHISNGGVSTWNPGVELLMFGFTIPLK